MSKKALIIGVSSQDGSYLADLLLEKGYEVVGTIRRTTSYDKENMRHLVGKIQIEAADLIDGKSIVQVIRNHQPFDPFNGRCRFKTVSLISNIQGIMPREFYPHIRQIV